MVKGNTPPSHPQFYLTYIEMFFPEKYAMEIPANQTAAECTLKHMQVGNIFKLL